MKILLQILTTGIIFSVSSCGESKKTDEGEIRGQEYTSREIGWTMSIPNGWKMIDLEKTEKSAQRGKKTIEETMNIKVDDSGVRNLISFEKNPFNIFQSSSEPFKLEYEGEWEISNSALKTLIYSTYVNQGMKTDSSATTIEKIDGLDFQTYSFTIYSPKGDTIMTQILYGRLINGLSFSASINYNNERDKNEMLKAFKTSRFTQRR